MADDEVSRRNKTLIITHDHCALHMTRKAAPERPARLQYVMGALKQLALEDAECARRLEIKEYQTSESMLAALSEQCCALAQQPRRLPAISRTMSVGYLEEKIVPSVQAVHSPQYLQKLGASCVQLLDAKLRCGRGSKAAAKALDKNLVELDGDTVVSASSLSAALCAALSCCHAVDACCDPHLPYANAFAVRGATHLALSRRTTRATRDER